MAVAWTEAAVLSPEGVAALDKDRSVGARKAVASEVATAVSHGALSQKELGIALRIVERLVDDVAVEVRACLAEHIKQAALLPRDLALRLAKDVEAVALPVIQVSELLRDEDLIEIVKLGSIAKQVAVAKRRSVSERVSAAIGETGNRAPLCALLGNTGARIADPTYEELAQRSKCDMTIKRLLVRRVDLPPKILNRLISTVTGSLRDEIMRRHNMPAAIMTPLAELVEERTLLEAAKQIPTGPAASVFLLQMLRVGTLTTTFLLRALSTGERRVFVAAMGVLADIPAENAAKLLGDQGTGGFRDLCRQAGIRGETQRLLRAALDAANIVAGRSDRPWSDGDTKQVIAHMVRATDNIGPGSLETVLSQVRTPIPQVISARPGLEWCSGQ